VVMEGLKFIQEFFDIARGEIKPRDGEPPVLCATLRSHLRPPASALSSRNILLKYSYAKLNLREMQWPSDMLWT
jgi:hypothetical protein